MGLRITNLSEVSIMFDMMDRNIPRQAREVLKSGAQTIVDQAIAFAPVDKHNLEKAIKLLPFQGNQYSLRIVIDVGGFVGGRNVDEYAAIVHEYPWSKRGPLTRVKSPSAGPRYLTRAFEKHRGKVKKDLQDSMAAEISKSIHRSGVNRSKRR